MKYYTKYILSLLLILTLMVSSFGLTVYNHFCGKTGDLSVSLINSPKCICEENIEENLNICNEEEHKNCCGLENNNTNFKNHKNIKSLECCSDNEINISLNENYLLKNINLFAIQSYITKIYNKTINYAKSLNTKIEKKIKEIENNIEFYKELIIKFHSLFQFSRQDDTPKNNAI